MEAADAYLEAQVLTASPHRLHLMVVDAALRFAHVGRMALESQQWEQLDTALSRSRDCVTELLGGIRDDLSPEMASSLKNMFTFIYRNLALADPERNVERIDRAIRALEFHRETWLEVGEAVSKTDSNVPAPHALSWMS